MAALMAAATGHRSDGAGQAVDLWPEFLRLLAQAMAADAVTLALGGVEGLGRVWHHGAAARLPDATEVGRMRVDRVYARADLPGARAEGPALRALRCRVPGGGHVVLIAQRRAAEFRAVDGARLASIGPMAAQAMAGWRGLQAERARAALDRTGAAGLGLDWLVIGAAGRVLAQSPGRADGFAAAGVRLRGDGGLGYADEMAEQVFRNGLARAEAGGAAFARRGPVHLAFQAGTYLGTPAVTVWLRHMPPFQAMPPDRLARALGLRPSEARLAARLADGETLAEAAAHLGWTIETARSTVKQVFARLGVTGQPGLMREMLARPGLPEAADQTPRSLADSAVILS